MTPISCDELAAIVDAYYDAATDRAAADGHLAGCEDCRQRLAAMNERLREMPCNEFVELVTDYLEDAAPSDLRARMDDHLRLCEGCRTYLDQMRQTIVRLGRLGGSNDDPAERLALLAVFREWRRDRARDPEDRRPS